MGTDISVSQIPNMPNKGSGSSVAVNGKDVAQEAIDGNNGGSIPVQGNIAGSLGKAANTAKGQDTKSSDSSSATQNNVALEHALSDINGYVQTLHRELKFSRDKNSGQTVVQVVNQETNEVIRQFPSEYVLKLAQVLQTAHNNLGSIFSDKA